jgi:hypothetical protein
MKGKQLTGRIAAVSAAVALTICGAWLAYDHAGNNALQAGSTAGEKQVIILDAGHGW